MLAEVTVTLSDWLLDELKAVLTLFIGVFLGYLHGRIDSIGQVKQMIRARSTRRKAVQR